MPVSTNFTDPKDCPIFNKTILNKIIFPLLLAALFLLPTIALSQMQHPQKKQYRCAKVDAHAISIDGSLDEPAWNKVEWGGGDFTVRQPNEGEEPSEKTLYKILYDEDFLYVGVRAYDAEPDKIVKRMSRRDGFEGDWVEINIDSNHDLQTAFSFTINAAGVKGDEYISQNGDNWDSSWDPIWYVKTSIDDEGWIAEMKIPFSQIRFNQLNEHVWGIQFTRRYFRKNERSSWVFIPQNSTGWVHHFGELHGIRNIKPPKQIEILPYSLAKQERFPAEEGNPFASGSDFNANFGLDGKIGLSSDMTMDFTINPDFGQVEADPSEVNLSAFETFFREKRPFFIEGRDILDFRVTSAAWNGSFGRDNIFYSRRIGRRPSFSPDLNDNEYSEVPLNSSILGALKLSGKTANGWSIGIMESITQEEKATIDLNGDRRKETVEPLTNYFVGRLQKDINNANSKIGVIATAVNRNINSDNLNFLHKSAYSAGIDFEHNFLNRKYYTAGNAVLSTVRGDEEAILETQTASARYFQRPDADHLDLDSSRTSLSGHGGTLKFGKRGNFKYQTGITWRSPGIELNDIGFLRSADEINNWTWVGYRITKPFAIFHNASINFNNLNVWDYDRNSLGNLLNTNGHVQLKDYSSLGGNITYEFDRLSVNALRGGPGLKLPGSKSGEFWYNSDQRSRFRFGGGKWMKRGNEDDQKTDNYWLWASIRPSGNFFMEINPFYTSRRNDMQYVSQVDERYIFGRLNQETAGISVRFNYSVTPELSIEYYGSPFVSAGEYSQFKQITDSKAAAYTDRFRTFEGNSLSYSVEDEIYQVDENNDGSSDFSFDNPDFNFRDFNSNLVIRWEYMPGSTLFLVWTQQRSSFVSQGSFSFNDDLDMLFGEPSYNVFLIKFNRWFSL